MKNLLYLLISLCSITLSAQHINIDMLDQLHYFSEPQWSPDGQQLVFTLRSSNFDDNRYEKTLYVYNTHGDQLTALTHDRPSVRMPRWSPDGEVLYFLAISDAGTQIYEMNMSGGEARQITTVATGISGYDISPDGQRITYITKDAAPERTPENKHIKSFEVGYDWYLAKEAARPLHLWICDSDGSNHRRLTSGDEGYAPISGSIDWSPDGTEIVYGSQPQPHSSIYLKTKLNTINVTTGEIMTIDDTQRVPRYPSYATDGSITYSKCLGKEFYFNPHGIHRANGGDVQRALGVDRNVLYHYQMPDGTFIAGGADGTDVSLWHASSDSRYTKVNTHGLQPQESGIDVNNNGQIVMIASSAHSPAELYIMDNLSAKPRQITHFNKELSDLTYGNVVTHRWENDGYKEDGVLIYPPNYEKGKKYPLVLFIHGGPMGKSLATYDFYGQMFAAEGWIVFKPNYRGSSNLGQEYQTAVINDAGEGPGRDVMAGIAALKEMGIVDEENIGASGWSYGGYMTAWLTSHYDGWKVAVAGAAVTDWFDWYSMADWNVWSGNGLGGSPWLNDNAENYRKQSPITYCHNIKTPTLILSNTMDERVTVTQSYKLWSCLMDNEVETKFIAYPLPGHFPRDPVHRQDVYRQWTDWLREHFD